jgi:hypothetical protein
VRFTEVNFSKGVVMEEREKRIRANVQGGIRIFDLYEGGDANYLFALIDDLRENLRTAKKANLKCIDELNEAILEQCRLNGMGSEREARLMARLAEKDKEINRLHDKYDLQLIVKREEDLRSQLSDLMADNEFLLRKVNVAKGVLKEISKLGYHHDFSTDANGEGTYNHAELAKMGFTALAAESKGEEK